MRKLKGILLFGLMVIAMLCVAGCGGTTVDLNKYVKIETSGYDSMGSVNYSFDYDSFEKDYSGKIKLDSKELELLFGGSAERVLIESCVSHSFDKENNLSNGDVVTLHWNCDDDTASKDFKVKLKYSDIEYTVKDLQEVKTFDPFEFITVTFSGIAPKGTVEIKKDENKEELNGINFTCKNNNSLSEGDTVTVEATLQLGEDAFVEKYGCAISETTKDYTVSGLDKAVSDVSEIPDDIYEKMDKQLQDTFKADFADYGAEYGKIKSMENIGNYILNAKKESNAYINNYVYFVYKVTVEKGGDTFSYYWYGGYTDVLLLADGTCTVNIGDYTTSDSWNDGESFEKKDDYYTGCLQTETIFNNVVTTKLDEYEYKSTITE